MKKLFFLSAVLFYTFSYSQDLNWDKSKGFEVTFDIENVYTSDGVNWEMSISGKAGPYGMGFGTITFKNFSSDQTQGEYSGYFWTQVDESTFRGTTSGMWKKEGKIYKTIAFDNDVVGGIINLATGDWNFVQRKASFKVAPLKK